MKMQLASNIKCEKLLERDLSLRAKVNFWMGKAIKKRLNIGNDGEIF